MADTPSLINDFVYPIISGVVGLAITWISVRVHVATGVTISQKQQDDLHRAADTGLQFALNEAGVVVAADLSGNAKAAVIGNALKWVNSSVPQAISALGISPSDITSIIQAKLQNVVTKNATPAIASLPASTGANGGIAPNPAANAPTSAQSGLIPSYTQQGYVK